MWLLVFCDGQKWVPMYSILSSTSPATSSGRGAIHMLSYKASNCELKTHFDLVKLQQNSFMYSAQLLGQFWFFWLEADGTLKTSCKPIKLFSRVSRDWWHVLVAKSAKRVMNKRHGNQALDLFQYGPRRCLQPKSFSPFLYDLFQPTASHGTAVGIYWYREHHNSARII